MKTPSVANGLTATGENAPVPTRPRRKGGVFAYSVWDAVAVGAAVGHVGYLLTLFVIFPWASWWVLVPMGFAYSVSISWNINGISHNFIHNPYFNSPFLNRCFSFLESLVCGFSQVFYECVHRRHHMGNSDHQDEHGDTIDWLSIYRHGHDGRAENVWTYTFLSYFRDDAFATYREIKRQSAREARWGLAEVAATGLMFLTGFVLNWRFMLFFIPFYYLGHSLSSLNGYYRHYGGNPDEPIAWGVSSYDRVYNLLWFNNGYHAEHHYRPRVHWTQMGRLHEQIRAEQEAKGVRVIRPPHALGFLEAAPPPPPPRSTDGTRLPKPQRGPRRETGSLGGKPWTRFHNR